MKKKIKRIVILQFLIERENFHAFDAVHLIELIFKKKTKSFLSFVTCDTVQYDYL